MYTKDPQLQFNIHDPHSPHSIVLNLVSDNRTLLDVGCNTGYIGEYFIKNKNCTCDGIDCDDLFLIKAKERGYRNLYLEDLYKSDFSINNKYDTILFVDILEHLPNPFNVLDKIVNENLNDGGQVVICLPNIARLEYRFKHFLGQFKYEESGIMHKDHLRFFTRESALSLIKQTALSVDKILPTGMGSKINMFQTLTAFQFIFLCTKP